jgi:hypothetical protein
MTDQGASASFARVGVVAEPELAAQVREEFAAWLRTEFVLDPRSRAMCCWPSTRPWPMRPEFAYLGSAEPA